MKEKNINDGISGSIVVSRNALKYIREQAQSIEAIDRSAFFLEVSKKADRLCKNYWYMAGVYNQLRNVVKNSRAQTRAEKDLDIIKKTFDEHILIEQNNADERLEKTGKNAARLFLTESSIFVFSNSVSVLKALSIYKSLKGLDLTIHTIEGKPGSEGLVFAESCAKMGFQVFVYPDLNMNNAIANSDLVIIGADRLLCREFFNKAGTSIVLDYAKKYAKVSAIITDQSKILKLADFLVGNIETATEPIFQFENEHISEISYAFERIAYDDVNKISTDIGNFEFEDFRVRYLE